jgi:hypothetical protein
LAALARKIAAPTKPFRSPNQPAGVLCFTQLSLVGFSHNLAFSSVSTMPDAMAFTCTLYLGHSTAKARILEPMAPLLVP